MTDTTSAVSNKFSAFIEQRPHLIKQHAIAVAVSGGPDSMALLSLLVQVYKDQPTFIHVLTVDHGLRLESKEEAHKVGEWVTALDTIKVTHHILVWTGQKPDTAIMQEARKVRYSLMAEYCHAHAISYLFVAHHLDDQRETFFIRLSKGSGLDGLAAMQDRTAYDEKLQIVRPFLSLPKADLEKYCQENSVPFVQDPSNKNTHYMRPRLRSGLEELRVLLEAEGLTAKRIGVLTKRLSRARNALEDITEEYFRKLVTIKKGGEAAIPYQAWRTLPEEIAFRVVQQTVTALQSEESDYGVRMERLENLFEALWFCPEKCKPRTLGGLIFALADKNQALYIRREK